MSGSFEISRPRFKVPQPNIVLVIRPNFIDCTDPNCVSATPYGYAWLQSIVDTATVRGFQVIDLAISSATSQQVQAALALDPGLIVGEGHGNDRVFTGQNYEAVWWAPQGPFIDKYSQPWNVPVPNIANLSQRHVHLLSCMTAGGLGKSISLLPANYVGWKVNYTFLSDTPAVKYSEAFKDGAVTFTLGILQGLTYQQAYDATIAKFNQWIDYWSRQVDFLAGEMVKWLAWDRDGLAIYSSTLTVDKPVVTQAVPIEQIALTALTVIPLVAWLVERLRG